MPFVKIATSAGNADIFYTVSTPSNDNADVKDIDRSIPTLLFIHAVYIAQEIFQLQFGDPKVRRFNCIALDQRGHGKTKNDRVRKGYGANEAGEDIAAFMKALDLPPCHLVAMSMGTIGAIALAMNSPDAIASLFLISPLGLVEPKDVAEGREEICECWKQGFSVDPPDEEALQDACFGGLQLSFSNEVDSLVNALLALTVAIGVRRWGRGNFDDYEFMTVHLFNNRKAYTPIELGRISCPVKLIHCAGDIAYPANYTYEFAGELKKAQVQVEVSLVPDGPHLGAVSLRSSGRAINTLLHDFVAGLSTTSNLPAIRDTVTSPYEADLIMAGWSKNGEGSGSDDE
ncbi:alpha/beta-hydrolase [Hymenopellis radicata]|nr:alpha/beta-hydrolase [Hymenopellis radicata]